MTPLLATILSVIAISLVSLMGIFFLFVKEKYMRVILLVLISFAVGTLLGDVFFHLLPELYESSLSPFYLGVYVLVGVCIFFILEHILHWRHDHYGAESTHAIHPAAYINITADALHNFVDGLILGATFLISIPLGIATTIAVLFHEIPQELGDFAILIKSGLSRTRAILFNFLSAIFAIIGGLSAILLGSAFESFSSVIMGITVGGFLYLSLTDLVPQLHEDIKPKYSIIQLIASVSGSAIMALLLLLD